MRKIRLDLESLDVESFDVTGGGRSRGTVEGLATVKYTEIYCTNDYTCYESCDGAGVGTCDLNTCWQSCNFEETCIDPTCGGLDSCNGHCYTLAWHGTCAEC